MKLTIAMLALSLLAGCGFKGDLYLPEANKPVATDPLPPLSTPKTTTTSKVKRIIPETVTGQP